MLICDLKLLRRHTLIITEKPDAAFRIALALDVEGKPKKKVRKGVPYYMAKRSMCIIIVPALGHLYTVAEEKRGQRDYPVFDFQWVPRYLVERDASRIRTWLEVISKLAENADRFIDACDYDVEGSVIGYSILKYACNSKEKIAERMKFSTLTKEELKKSYAKSLSSLNFGLIEAGLTRHEVDWLYGINLSRALTMAVKNSGRYSTLSSGRVQGPTLKFLATRERSIKCFVPTPYWNIKAAIKINSGSLEMEYTKNPIYTKAKAISIVDSCLGNEAEIENVTTKTVQQNPPLPFNLGSLQHEAYRIFGYLPIRTLNIAQRLYLAALISYPRTSSQKLPRQIVYNTILKKLSRIPEYEIDIRELLTKSTLNPKEGKKSDPAHPAIYPTGNLPERSLNRSEKNIWELIIRRFMAVFADPALIEITKVCIDINGNKFQLKEKRTIRKGWLRFYSAPVKQEHCMLPLIQKGKRLCIERIIMEDKFTAPPSRYNPSSILRRMEKEEIGTKTTRARIIQTLNTRKYVRKEKIEVTDLGFEVIDILKKYCPTIVSLELTRKLEERLNDIQQGNETREKVLYDTIKILKPQIKLLKEKEKAVGSRLSQALVKTRLEDRVIGPCPTCKNGVLLILKSRKTGKRFIGCTNYFEGVCKTSFPLPQKGVAKPTGIVCRYCGWNTVQIRVKGRRSWNLCFNPECPLKERRKKSEMCSL